MKKIILILPLVLLFSLFNAQQGLTSKDWKKLNKIKFKPLLKDYNLNFNRPKGFTKVRLKENKNVPYYQRFKHDSSEFEMRIWIRNASEDSLIENMTFDVFSKSFLTMVCLNASGMILPNVPEIKIFDKPTASSEYNADWVGASAFLTKNNEFADGFNICSVLAFRKNNIAEVYLFFMIKNREEEAHLVKDLSKCITFK